MRNTFLILLLLLTFTSSCGITADVYGQGSSSGRAKTKIVVNDQALINAVLEDDLAAVNAALKAGINPNLKFYDKDSEEEITVLMRAAFRGGSEIVEALLAAGANVNERGQSGETALQLAVIPGNIEKVKVLLHAGADVNTEIYATGYTPLLSAVMDEREDIVKALLGAGALVNVKVRTSGREDDSFTPLLWAVERGNSEIAKMLLEAGADLNAKNKEGKTALIMAIEKGRKEMVELLQAATAASK